MTDMIPQSALKNIVDNWRQTNEIKILEGLEIKTPMELLKLE